MHPTILAKRKADAVGKLTYAAEALAELLNLDSALIAGLHPVGIHDTLLREMLLLEGVANLITAVAIEAGAIQEGVSMETPQKEEADAHWVEPTTEPPLAPDRAQETEFLSPETAEAEQLEVADSAEDSGVGLEGLPAPTLEEAPVKEEPPAPKKSKPTRQRVKK
ncbi:MAG: hypothetical protein ACRD2L_07005 [Terriglobia bacterium]